MLLHRGKAAALGINLLAGPVQLISLTLLVAEHKGVRPFGAGKVQRSDAPAQLLWVARCQ